MGSKDAQKARKMKVSFLKREELFLFERDSSPGVFVS
jgi:hypothetical protein